MEFAVAVDEIGVGEEVHPIVDVNVESAEQTFVFECPALKHLLRFNFAGVTEVLHQQRAHLPAVTHFLDHHAGNGTAVPVCGSSFEQVSLLLDAGKFGIALIDDHVQQGIAHLLRGNLAQVFPFALAFEMAELDFVGLNGAKQRVEFEAGNLIAIDANLFTPFVEESDPVRKCSDFCYFARHSKISALGI